MQRLDLGTILVTGSNGFIGKNLIKHLEGESIITCDYGEADVEPHALLEFIETHKIGTIIHLGAISSTTETDIKKLRNVNVGLTLKLFNWCVRNNIPLIYASSAATYGDGSNGYEDTESLEYLRNLKPLNAYGQSKADADTEIFSQIDPTITPQVVALKFFNVYGPHESHKGEMRSVARKLYDSLKCGQAH